MKITTFENKPKLSGIAPGTIIAYHWGSQHSNEYLIIHQNASHTSTSVRRDRNSVLAIKLDTYNLSALPAGGEYTVVGSISE